MKLALAVIILAALVSCNSKKPESVQAAGAQPSVAVSVTTTATPANDPASPLPHVDGARGMQYTREIVAFGARPPGSPAHRKLEAYIRAKLKGDHVEEDVYTAGTPAGQLPGRNFIVKYPGTKPGVVVISGHYDTLFSNRQFVGANDGGSSTALLLAMADQLRGRKFAGPSVWLVFFDGEEAIRQWSEEDSLYGSRHLAAKWSRDGTTKMIKALFNVDMIGDADLNIEQDQSSSPELLKLLYAAAQEYGYQSHFFARAMPMDDDHIPFARAGVPVADVIDFNYGYNNAFWHTEFDTLDKLSSRSFEIVGSVVLRAAQMVN